eukprot:1154191-Pelagomonas_calceolata.AAC.1
MKSKKENAISLHAVDRLEGGVNSHICLLELCLLFACDERQQPSWQAASLRENLRLYFSHFQTQFQGLDVGRQQPMILAAEPATRSCSILNKGGLCC